MDKRNRPVESGFNSEWFDVPLNVLHASKAMPPRVKQSAKYAQIRSSVEVIGLVEPVVVIPHASVPGHFSILDGHLRVEVLNDLGRDRARCLISKDDEGLTYNKRVNRLAAIQEYNMIVRVYESGVTVERLAAALGLSVGTIRDRFRMLDGICDEAIKLLSDKRIPRRVFSILRQMKPFRQIDAAHAMINLDNYSGKFALAMLETTPEDQLADAVEKRQEKSGTIEAIQRLERELAVLQADTKLLEENYGPDSLKLVVIKTYVASLLDNARVVRWLAQFRSDYLQQLQLIAEVKTLAVVSSDR
ncbi:plasmid partitioning protein RepB C-terminal domain-containing protein [Burkholderia ubonensis]|uniref:plasmid partitioning protein RepB C-terminal domain-containing protein n=1 Tax=Burkholderia ubonensis TaxID=101571 RepID=UPI000F55F604|nr:plasmid partitioning protein RepB C-terminal domain-containing protein [Burkholderia ubonensis]RQP34138.1 chromosome partitioning protein ParB [Burkholderia ubonensis]RQP40396.1 chromosome partitioning protein ParB [Burkholderia ubonensis]RQP40535.1 chromosome partitioning protein ParB [Burkholderia ubonensis]RQP53929.1 chromosome partitioning protein ParB [Burkholderia ubonensis]RQP57411.1 chromosome partitioning protein ParB [Burkholderia ubonensis]